MQLKHFSLGIIDILGIMIPGAVWVFVLLYIHFLFPAFLEEDCKICSRELTRLSSDHIFAVNTFMFLFFSYVLGYVSRIVAPPRFLDLPMAFLPFYRTGEKWLPTIKSHPLVDRTQPYDFLFRTQRDDLMKLVKGAAEFTVGYVKFFHLCKRFLLDNSVQLWADAERREAEIRLINGLFYPGLALSIIFFSRGSFIPFLISMGIIILLGFSFKRRRYAEVSFVYGATFTILNRIGKYRNPGTCPLLNRDKETLEFGDVH